MLSWVGWAGRSLPRPLLAVPNVTAAVTFGTARRGLKNSLPINGQCANFVLYDVAL